MIIRWKILNKLACCRDVISMSHSTNHKGLFFLTHFLSSISTAFSNNGLILSYPFTDQHFWYRIKWSDLSSISTCSFALFSFLEMRRAFSALIEDLFPVIIHVSSHVMSFVSRSEIGLSAQFPYLQLLRDFQKIISVVQKHTLVADHYHQRPPSIFQNILERTLG